MSINALDPAKFSSKLIIAKVLCNIRTTTPEEIWKLLGKEGSPDDELVNLLQDAKTADFELFDTCIVNKGMVDKVNESTEKLSNYLEKISS